jgi:hypothetical protein
MKHLSICQWCSVIVEDEEDLCQGCFNFDDIEAQSADYFLDELIVDDLVEEHGIDGIRDVTIIRKTIN